jgi:hypothetical protein
MNASDALRCELEETLAKHLVTHAPDSIVHVRGLLEPAHFGNAHARELYTRLQNGGVDREALPEYDPTLKPDSTGRFIRLLAQELVSIASAEVEASEPGDWEPRSLIALSTRPPEPPTVGDLFYPRRRHVVSGEYECGKSWLLLCVAAAELLAERGVVWVDADDMGDGAILERLRQLGVPDDRVHTHFGYLRPADALTADGWRRVEKFIYRMNARLAVFDAFNPMLALHGLDPAKTPDVERFYTTVVDPFRRAGCAAVALDHVVKNPEASRRYSYGSERKASGAEVHIGLTVVDAFGRGKTGRAKLTVHKDRPGFLTRPSPGLLVVKSDPDDGRCSWHVAADTSVTDGGEFRPTGLMEKVSRYLEAASAPRSRTQIEEAVTGRATYKRLAIDLLVAEGFAAESPGDRKARMVRIERVFREADEVEE